jgi:hypothetical protein
VPDLIGFSAREAVRQLSRLGLRATLEGDGVVVEQDPPQGAPAVAGMECRLRLQRRPTAAATGGTQP